MQIESEHFCRKTCRDIFFFVSVPVRDFMCSISLIDDTISDKYVKKCVKHSYIWLSSGIL